MENGMRRWVNNNEMPSKMPRMIYMMGTAISGSTILEILLGKGKGVFGAGELAHLIEDGFIKDADCSCNHPVSECMVWSSIKEEPPESSSRSINSHARFAGQPARNPGETSRCEFHNVCC